MRFDVPFADADVRRADQQPVTSRIYANATFEGVRALHVFAQSYLQPVLHGFIAPTPRERSILGLYYRLAAYVASVRRLDAPIDFQSIASAARSIFELALDIALVAADQTTDSIDRLVAFTRVERYRVANRLVHFYSQHPLPRNLNIAVQQRVCADPSEKTQVEQLVLQYWGRKRNGDLNWPKHWSTFADARTRARRVAAHWEERYVRHYSMLSWHVHPGVVGAAGLQPDSFDVFVSEAHVLFRDSVLEVYEILGRELRLAQAINDWVRRIGFLRHVSGVALVDQRLQSLGEPSRFIYLEEHEGKM